MTHHIRREPAEQEKIEAGIRRVFEHNITFNKFLGFKVGALSAKQVSINFDMRAEFVGHFLHGRLHGGVISSVLDAIGGLAVLWSTAEKYPSETAEQTMSRFAQLGTVDLRIDYLRQGIGEHFEATAQTLRLGDRIASTQMQLKDDNDRLVATGAATYIVS